MRGSRGAVAGLWALFAAVAIVSGWIAVQMVGSAVTPASIPVLTVGEVSQGLVTSAPTDEPTPVAKPRPSKSKGAPSSTPSPSTSSRPSPTPTASAKTTTTPPRPKAVVRTLASRGGSVVAACSAGQVTLRSWSPAVGYRVDEVDPGPDEEVELRFVSNDSEATMQVRCLSGVPAARTEYGSESGDDG